VQIKSISQLVVSSQSLTAVCLSVCALKMVREELGFGTGIRAGQGPVKFGGFVHTSAKKEVDFGSPLRNVTF